MCAHVNVIASLCLYGSNIGIVQIGKGLERMINKRFLPDAPLPADLYSNLLPFWPLKSTSSMEDKLLSCQRFLLLCEWWALKSPAGNHEVVMATSQQLATYGEGVGKGNNEHHAFFLTMFPT